MNRNKRVAQLRSEVRRWIPRSTWQLDSVEVDSVSEIGNAVILVKGLPWVHFGYALRELLVAIGKWRYCVSVAEEFWGSDESAWCAQQHDYINRLMERALNAYGKLLSPALDEASFSAVQVLSQYERLRAMPVINDEQIDLVDVTISMLSEYRDELAVQVALANTQQPFHSSFALDIAELLRGLNLTGEGVRSATANDRDVLGWLVSNYRASEWIFSWMSDSFEGDAQAGLAAIASIPSVQQEIAVKNFDRIMSEIHDKLPINFDEYEQLHSIIRRVCEAIGEVGFKEFADAVTAHGGQSGGRSLLGNLGPINLIPADSGGVCCSTVVAVARGGRDTKRGNGVSQVMRALRAHLIDCLEKTKVSVIITDTIDPLTKESRQDLLAHMRRGVVVIVLHVVGNTINLVDLGS